MGDAAVAAAKAIGYSGAGTVEFIAEQDGRFYFMEMNTRLQVEHPVTEMITGLDLVEWQLRVAGGEKLPLQQKDIAFSGHAIEARIYAENPARDFLPATGRLLHVSFPAASVDVRVDTGVESGSEITPWYDPMIAKLIVRGADRAAALTRLRQALAEVEIAGPPNNVAFLGRVAASRAFAGAQLDTGLIERNGAELLPHEALSDEVLAAAAFAELLEEQRAASERAAASGDLHSPWHAVDGWRLNQDSHHDFTFLDGDTPHATRIRFLASGLRLAVNGREYSLAGEPLADGRMLVRLDGRAFKVRAVRDGNVWYLLRDGSARRLSLAGLAAQEEDTGAGSLAAPMSGKVVKVLTKPGAKVSKGDALLILEAMKMEHTIAAPRDGVVKEIPYDAGEQVPEGAELVIMGTDLQ